MRLGNDGDSSAHGERIELAQRSVLAKENSRDGGTRRVAIRRKPAAREWVPDRGAANLTQMHVTERLPDAAQHRLPGDDLFAVADLRGDVVVLERSFLAGVDRNLVAADDVGRSRDNWIDRRAVGRRDVDAVVEEERAGSREAVVEDGAKKDGAWIAEVRADRVLLVEGLDRPRVRGNTGARDERGAAEERDENGKAEAHGSLDGSARRRLAGPEASRSALRVRQPCGAGR